MKWQNLGPIDSFPAETVLPVALDGLNVVVIQAGPTLYHCFRDRCSHQDVKLSDFGAIRNGELVCDAHGAFFELASGARLKGPNCGALDRFETKVESGILYAKIPT